MVARLTYGQILARISSAASGLLLLWHNAGARREAVRQLAQSESCSEHQITSSSAKRLEVQCARSRRQLKNSSAKVTIAHRSRANSMQADQSPMLARCHLRSIGKEVPARAAAPNGSRSYAAARIFKARGIAPQHLDISHHMMPPRSSGWAVLQMREAQA